MGLAKRCLNRLKRRTIEHLEFAVHPILSIFCGLVVGIVALIAIWILELITTWLFPADTRTWATDAVTTFEHIAVLGAVILATVRHWLKG